MQFPKAATKIQPSEAKVGDLILAKGTNDTWMQDAFWIFRCTEVGFNSLKGSKGRWDTFYAEFYRLDLDKMYVTVVGAEVE